MAEIIKPLSKGLLDPTRITSLSDRPNETGAYGVGGLNAAQLKAQFDRMGLLIKDKLNELIILITEGGISDSLKVEVGDLSNLQELLDSITSGLFARTLKANDRLLTTAEGGALASLQEIINKLEAEIKALRSFESATNDFKANLKSAPGELTPDSGAGLVGIPDSFMGTGKNLYDYFKALKNGAAVAHIVVSDIGSMGVEGISELPELASLKQALQKLVTAISTINARYVATATKVDNHETRITNQEAKVGSMHIDSYTANLGASNLASAVSGLKVKVDNLQQGVIPRQIRGAEPLQSFNPAALEDRYPNKAQSDTLRERLTARVQEVVGRSPNNSDAVQVIDCEMPDKGKLFTYYYWDKTANSAPDAPDSGWYQAALSIAPSLADIGAYVRYIRKAEWSAKLSDENNPYIKAILEASSGDFDWRAYISNELKDMHVVVIPASGITLVVDENTNATIEGHGMSVDSTLDIDFRYREDYPRGLNALSIWANITEAIDSTGLEDFEILEKVAPLVEQLNLSVYDNYSPGYARAENYFIAENGTVILYSDDPPEQATVIIRAGKAYYTASETHILDVPISQVTGLRSELDRRVEKADIIGTGATTAVKTAEDYSSSGEIARALSNKVDSTAMDTALAGKANSGHNHDSNYLGKAAKAKASEKADVAIGYSSEGEIASALASKVARGDIIGVSATTVVKIAENYADGNTSYNIKNKIGDLNTAISGKANNVHSHDTAYAPKSHEHGGYLKGTISGDTLTITVI